MKNIEYEDRVMLTFDQYGKILSDYIPFHHIFNFSTIENTYFDDDNLSLINNGKMLRLRKINQKEELTLKIKGDQGDIEINETLLSHPEINQALPDVFTHYHPISKLKTNRVELPMGDYLLVIDQNMYNGRIDYDLEIEASSKEKAHEIILNFCQKYHIEYKKDYLPKSSRAILTRNQ